MQIEEIMRFLPHRYPMLLVDRVLDIQLGKSCRGLKNVTMNEPFFQGHYPGLPIMPGVLIVEAMAQAGAILILADPQNEGLVPLIGSIGEVKIKRPVVPGDQLISDCEVIWFRNRMGKMRGVATVDGQEVLTTEITFKLVPRSF